VTSAQSYNETIEYNDRLTKLDLPSLELCLLLLD